MWSQIIFIVSRQVADEELCDAGEVWVFIPFPGEDLEQTLIMVRLIDCWWVGQAQYILFKSVNKFIKICRKILVMTMFPSGCKKIVCGP